MYASRCQRKREHSHPVQRVSALDNKPRGPKFAADMGGRYVKLSSTTPVNTSGGPRPEDAREEPAQLLQEFWGLGFDFFRALRERVAHTAPACRLPMLYPRMHSEAAWKTGRLTPCKDLE